MLFRQCQKADQIAAWGVGRQVRENQENHCRDGRGGLDNCFKFPQLQAMSNTSQCLDILMKHSLSCLTYQIKHFCGS